MKFNSYTTLIPPPLPDEIKGTGVRVYVTELNADFSCDDITQFSIQDPVWVNYDVDGYQVRLDIPLLSSAEDVHFEHIFYYWKRNCLLTSLRNTMQNYGKIKNCCFMELKYLLNGLSNKFCELIMPPGLNEIQKIFLKIS